jgi:hypothetical protein
MLRFTGCQLGVNLSKRVFEGNSRVASLAFNKNDGDTWWSSRRKTAQLLRGESFRFGFHHK